MATRTERIRVKAEQRRRLTLFFNKEARKSAADALKKASWLMAAATAALGYAQGSVSYLVLVGIGWIVTQTLSILILSIEEDGSKEPKEQQDGNSSRGVRRSAES